MSNQYTTSYPFTPGELQIEYQVMKMTQAELAKKYGVTQKVIWGVMKKWGIKSRIPAKRNQTASMNSYWKGDAASYAALHKRIENMFGRPMKCETCGTEDPERAYDWANLSGKYADPKDYKRMCRSCHWKLDGKHKNFKKGGDAPCP